MIPFTQEVVDVIRSIPAGRVMTYGQVARLAGNPRAARQVAWILHSLSRTEQLPWYRVLNAKGEISLDGDEQQLALEAEGIVFERPGKLSLSRYQV
ncbi:Methylated-DNA-(protein)-cysteine S-methyltransferase DNA binding [Exiguobacterium sibiricum 255-15]|uniref:Methylated-DNA-(Protein)-cysteine S-methyltransferase DNA binding n=1 Tax=Exiguobacterium sibiricum (strain DSM 17290 / CCUG 55495 / CIP 109462 / JCM 13490 / 255-15) TaxID=262543 RepID=B1YMF5_EXIS2|nr:MGMT family protein [Exiguobacterium sibiricum]ACB60542.1 Methylated-DNA-(protein)-cysteine S-methyltransferase DNA binding [Exiguobacterium sibiricum 255-15]